MKLLKFEMMVGSINKKFYTERLHNSKNVALALVFDYDRCNDYAKKIFENSNLIITTDIPKDNYLRFGFILNGYELWNNKYNEIKLFNDIKTKTEAAKLFIQCCVDSKWLNLREAYRFLFWSLFILTVDKYNADEYLSTICDFSKMLRISDKDFESIINLIKCIYKRKGNVDELSSSEIFVDAFDGIFDEFKL